MEKITGNEPAMPVEMDYEEGGAKSHRVSNSTWKETGLTIRQHFAAMAMQGFISSIKEGYQSMHRDAAEQAVEFADALIAHLNQPTKS